MHLNINSLNITVCLPWTNNYFCKSPWNLLEGQKNLGVTILTGHRLSSTDQDWRIYGRLTLAKTWCSLPKYSCESFSRNWKFSRQYLFIFFAPWEAFLMISFYPRSSVACPLGKRSGHLGLSRLWENKLLKFDLPISPYKSTFLRFGSRVLVLERKMTPYRHTDGSFLWHYRSFRPIRRVIRP